MCYDVAYLTKKKEAYVKRYGNEADIVEILKKVPPTYHSNGFDHAQLPIIANNDPDRIKLFDWGLIPFWVKDPQQALKLSNSTLNARGEELWEKPAFLNVVDSQRCLVIVDGFYEHHWKDDKAYPFFIKMKDGSPFSLAGLWSVWKYPKEDIIRNTFTIVTTSANPMMEEIHNKPKASEGHRMPLILPENKEHLWLQEGDKDSLKSLIRPFNHNDLLAVLVGKLRGKAYPGNVPEVMQSIEYPELKDRFTYVGSC